jgi:L-serine/L-threonine ammonia-lyase
MIGKLRKAGATEVLQHGESWYEADAYLRGTVIPEAEKKGEHAVYVPPFDARAIWEGNATLVEEVVGEIGVPNAVVCSVGGGGLFSGVMLGREQLGKQGEGMKVVAVETEGADSLSLSLRNGELSTLPAITSVATSLGARTVARQAFEYAQLDCVRSVVLSDRDAMGACVRFADEERMMVETACGVCLALCYQGRLRELVPELTEESNVVVVVCGGSNITEGMLHAWAESLKGRDE